MPSIAREYYKLTMLFFPYIMLDRNVELTIFNPEARTAGFSETLILIYQMSRLYMPEEHDTNVQGRKNPESYF
jgi:hypothetical protein